MGEAKRRAAAGFTGRKARAITRREPRWLRDKDSSPTAKQAQWERAAAKAATAAAEAAVQVRAAREAFLRQQGGEP
jgi:hypothetical protein